jgi:hypothetical protein
MFKKACDEFKNFSFEAKFKAKSIFLLKHNGKTWDICHEFEFNQGSI